MLRFAASVAEEVAEFVFHPDQTVERDDDGSTTVRFTAGGVEEMCWHLVTWGDRRHRRAPRPSAPTPARDVRHPRQPPSRGIVIRH